MEENVAVVTGGTGGLGRALLPYLIRRNFKIAVTYLIPEEARKLEDEFGLDELRMAVEMRDARPEGDRPELEASGGITLANVAEVAETGVDRISVGALTHSAPALDVSLEVLPE